MQKVMDTAFNDVTTDCGQGYFISMQVLMPD
jgi:hypothetical protein